MAEFDPKTGIFQVEGNAFDAAAVPDEARELYLYTVRKADLARLDGMEKLSIKSLNLRWYSDSTLERLSLPGGLKALKIWHSPKIKSLDGIERAYALNHLHWMDNRAFPEAAALHALPKLQEILIEGGMNSKERVDDLSFLNGLTLRHLRLHGIKPGELDISPVLGMNSLLSFECHGPDLEPASLAKLCARFPALYDQLMAIEDYPPHLGMRCKTCGGVQKMLFLRKRKFLWCPDCDANGLAKQLDKFAAMVEDARQAGITPVSGSNKF